MFESWQDIVLTLSNLVFLSALVPMLFSRDLPPVFTSALNGSALTAVGVTYLTLHLYFSAASVILAGVLWFAVMTKKMGWW